MIKIALILSLGLFMHSVSKKNITNIVIDGFIVLIVILSMIYQSFN